MSRGRPRRPRAGREPDRESGRPGLRRCHRARRAQRRHSHGAGRLDKLLAAARADVIREITPDGVIHRFAGTGTEGSALSGAAAASAELDQPEAVAANAAGDVFISDTDNNRVLEVSPQGSIISVIASGKPGYAGDGQAATAAAVELDQPSGLAVDAKGNLYIADSANNVIRRVDAATGIITTVAGDYAADAASGGLGGFDGDGGAATSARLNDPEGVAIDGAGDLFIADTFNNAIRLVNPAGTISTVVNSAAAAGAEASGSPASGVHLNAPGAVAVDQATSILYIAGHAQQRGRRGVRPRQGRRRGRPRRPGRLVTPARPHARTSARTSARGKTENSRR